MIACLPSLAGTIVKSLYQPRAVILNSMGDSKRSGKITVARVSISYLDIAYIPGLPLRGTLQQRQGAVQIAGVVDGISYGTESLGLILRLLEQIYGGKSSLQITRPSLRICNIRGHAHLLSFRDLRD